jgi:hypothetical protein
VSNGEDASCREVEAAGRLLYRTHLYFLPYCATNTTAHPLSLGKLSAGIQIHGKLFCRKLKFNGGYLKGQQRETFVLHFSSKEPIRALE